MTDGRVEELARTSSLVASRLNVGTLKANLLVGGRAVSVNAGYRVRIIDSGVKNGVVESDPVVEIVRTPVDKYTRTNGYGFLPPERVHIGRNELRPIIKNIDDEMNRVWGALDAISQATSPQTLASALAEAKKLLLPDDVVATLQQAHDVKLRALTSNPDAKVFRLGPRALADVVKQRARQNRGLVPTTDALQTVYARLPKVLQQWVDRSAAQTPLLNASGRVEYGSQSWIEAQDDKSWRNGGSSAFRSEGIRVVNTNTGDMHADSESRCEVSRGQALNADYAPSFLPQPSRQASALDLAMGAALTDAESLAWFKSRLDRVETTPYESRIISDMPRSTTGPRALRSILPELRKLPREQWNDALPWMLLEYMMTLSNLGGDRPLPRVHLDDVKSSGRMHDEPVEGLYVEWAKDERDTFNADRELCQGDLENAAVRALRKYAPRLFKWAVALRGTPELGAATTKTIARHKQEQPLKDFNVIAIQHLLDDNMVAPLTDLGLDPKNAHVLGIPYSTNEVVAERLRDKGFDVDTNENRDLPYPLWREMQVSYLVKKALADHAQNGKKILVLDDGGYIVSVLKKHFPEQAHLFTVVEQTTHGLRVAEGMKDLPTHVVSIAKAECKKPELDALEASIGAEVTKRLQPFADPSFLPGRPAVVVGFGWIGTIVARALAAMGRSVVIVDPSEDAQRRAQELGYGATSSLDDIGGNCCMIAGNTGSPSIKRKHLAKLEDGQAVFSCSSSNFEIELDNDAHFHEDLVVQDGKACYVALGAGYPINFNGRGDINTPAELQYTRAGMIEALCQAAEIAKSRDAGAPSVHALDPARDQAVLTS